MTAIVFNCAYNGLSIIQELGRRGVDVHALDSFRNIGTTSKYATYHSCPNPTTDEEGFIEFLLEIAPEFDDTPVLIPTNDHWAAAVARHRDRLAKHYHPCVADAQTVDLLLNKDAFGEWALEQGHPVPRSWAGSEVGEIPDDAFPVAAKPSDATGVPDMMFDSKIALLYNKLFGSESEEELTETERDVVEALSEIRLEVLESRAELDRFVTEYDDVLEHFVIQEYVRGMSDQMYTVGVYANEGTIKGLFTGRKVRGYPPDVGDCKVGQAQSVPDHLINSVESMCDELGYHGIAEFEFKRDAETGEYYLIEINPRSWSWIGITPACGVSLPWMSYADLAGVEQIEFAKSSVADGSVTWAKVFEDALNCLYFYHQSHKEWAMDPKSWWNSVNTDKLVISELSRDDPFPACYALLLVVRRLLIAMKQGVGSRL
ncbi:ATP-grasp domain-containing protein [Natronococcus pandeyae]|uniref:ATP-grasp domain-containing protein n=1 Tax=Natronococcus pandeyae TaxID=2055836 RepID=A0A8J8Q4V4_9EURY|nr:ATP-grasp domain-containing protein [Natronococcus pandeyae]TYL37230.1 ATP-grasp domain-containing protein [Natronococcus pandeyae]